MYRLFVFHCLAIFFLNPSRCNLERLSLFGDSYPHYLGSDPIFGLSFVQAVAIFFFFFAVG